MEDNSNSELNSLLAERFYGGLEYLSTLMGKIGIAVDAYPEDLDRTSFLRYEEPHQLAVLHSLENYIGICKSALGHGSEYVGMKALTWQVLKYMDFTVRDDVLNYPFQDGDVVEIYDINNKLIFASLEFLMGVSYTLLDLCCNSWEQLYERDPAITARLIGESRKILTGEVQETIFLNIPEHMVTEAFSKKRHSAWSQPLLFSPVYRHGILAGFIDVIRVRRV